MSRKRVIRVMQQEGLKARVRRRFKSTTISEHNQPVAANILASKFSPSKPNESWVGDVNELLTGNGKIYLAVIIDLGSRMIVGWSLSACNDRHLVIRALQVALNRRRPSKGLLAHTYQGSPRASEDYQRLLRAHDITCSMSRRGNCHDNAVAESFFSTLKLELGERFPDNNTAKHSLID